MVPAATALARLKEGNARHRIALAAADGTGPDAVAAHIAAQHPFACVVACSDSRVIPEEIFSVGPGEIFTVRVAGNVVDGTQLGSIEYAVHHLGVQLVVVLGHTHCGAVAAALERGGDEGHVATVVSTIREAIGDEEDPVRACAMNVAFGVETVKNDPAMKPLVNAGKLEVAGALFALETGEVKFLG